MFQSIGLSSPRGPGLQSKRPDRFEGLRATGTLRCRVETNFAIISALRLLGDSLSFTGKQKVPLMSKVEHQLVI